MADERKRLLIPGDFVIRLRGEFDRIFGQEACLKTFGTSVPTIKQFEEFTDKFGLLIDQWIKEK